MGHGVGECLVMTTMSQPVGCDTFVAFPPLTKEGCVIFGKNSDRPAGEKQSICQYPAGIHDDKSYVECTYIKIPQAHQTYALLLSRIDWMWGAEMGANECGVVIGNEAVWTVEPNGPPALLGMDLVRLGLERGRNSRHALEVITELLEKYGQGGACAKNDNSFTYHNSFLIADCNEAWILETAGGHWVAERITKGGRNISNGLTIRTQFDLSSKDLKEHAKNTGIWDGHDTFDFAACFSSDGIDQSPYSRQACGAKLLETFENKNNGTFDSSAMMHILRDHEGGICMHGGFETTSSMISELHKPDTDSNDKTPVVRHWLTGMPYPCKSAFSLYTFDGHGWTT